MALPAIEEVGFIEIRLIDNARRLLGQGSDDDVAVPIGDALLELGGRAEEKVGNGGGKLDHGSGGIGPLRAE